MDSLPMNDLTWNVYVISRYTHGFYARELKKLHITMGQFSFIMLIADNDGISQERLSSILQVGKSTTATIVRQLLAAGLITREIDETDRRIYHLHATKKARNLVPKIRAIIDECHRKMTDRLTDIEKSIFLNLLQKVRERTTHVLGGKRGSLPADDAE